MLFVAGDVLICGLLGFLAGVITTVLIRLVKKDNGYLDTKSCSYNNSVNEIWTIKKWPGVWK